MRVLWSCYLLLFISSCSVNGNFKGLLSYYSQTDRECPDLIQRSELSSSSLCELRQKKDPVVYLVRGAELKNCIDQTSNSVVYLSGPNCKAPFCRPLGELQERCDSNALEFFVLAEYYDAQQMKLPHAIEKPVFGVDVKYYRSNVTHKYLRRFMDDLLDDGQDLNGRYLYFKDGKYEASYVSIDELLSKQ